MNPEIGKITRRGALATVLAITGIAAGGDAILHNAQKHAANLPGNAQQVPDYLRPRSFLQQKTVEIKHGESRIRIPASSFDNLAYHRSSLGRLKEGFPSRAERSNKLPTAETANMMGLIFLGLPSLNKKWLRAGITLAALTSIVLACNTVPTAIPNLAGVRPTEGSPAPVDIGSYTINPTTAPSIEIGKASITDVENFVNTQGKSFTFTSNGLTWSGASLTNADCTPLTSATLSTLPVYEEVMQGAKKLETWQMCRAALSIPKGNGLKAFQGDVTVLAVPQSNLAFVVSPENDAGSAQKYGKLWPLTQNAMDLSNAPSYDVSADGKIHVTGLNIGDAQGPFLLNANVSVDTSTNTLPDGLMGSVLPLLDVLNVQDLKPYATTTAPAEPATQAPVVPSVEPTATESTDPETGWKMQIVDGEKQLFSPDVNQWVTSGTPEGSLNGGIPIVASELDIYGYPNMVPFYYYKPVGVSGINLTHPYEPNIYTTWQSKSNAFTSFFETRLAARLYQKDQRKISVDEWKSFLTGIKNGDGSVVINFTTPDGVTHFWKPSREVGYKYYEVNWEDANPASHPNYWETEYDGVVYRWTATTDQKGNLIVISAVKDPSLPNTTINGIYNSLGTIVENSVLTKANMWNFPTDPSPWVTAATKSQTPGASPYVRIIRP